VAHAIDDVLVERRQGPIALAGMAAEAVYQVLLPSYTKAADRATLALFAALHQLYG
jgi:hypothetical protein